MYLVTFDIFQKYCVHLPRLEQTTISNIGTGAVHVDFNMVKVFAQIVSKLVMLTMMFPMPITVTFSVIAGQKERNRAVL